MTHFAGTTTANFGQNSPTGAFLPEIYSKNVLLQLRRGSVADSITNSEYFGEISAFGDTVRIMAEPDITIKDYTRGLELTTDAVEDTDKTITIDQAKYWQFSIDDIEDKMSHVGWEAIATNRAAYKLMQDYDVAILNFMSDSANVLAANVFNDKTEAAVLDLSTPDALLDHITDMSVRLSLQDNVNEGRYLVLPYTATGVLSKVDSKLINMDYNGGAADLKSSPSYMGTLRGFDIYVTNNAPSYTSTGTGATTRDVMLAGQMSACSTAQTILRTEVLRDNLTFGDKIRGQHVYGRGIIRPEALSVAHVKFSA